MSQSIKLSFIVMTTLMMVNGYPATYPNYVTPHHQLIDYEIPINFESSPSPLNNPQKSPEYQSFLNELYRFDKQKAPPVQIHQQYQVPVVNYQNTYNPYQQYPQGDLHNINKRAIVFRPLFVYKQQTIKKEKLKHKNMITSSTPASYVPANKSPTFVDGNNQIYQQYNPYYYPYQYGQRYPYIT